MLTARVAKEGCVRGLSADVTRCLFLGLGEDRVLFAMKQPTFEDYCTQEEGERLLSGLSAPLLRIPLTLGFFGPSRIFCALTQILRAEPRSH